MQPDFQHSILSRSAHSVLRRVGISLKKYPKITTKRIRMLNKTDLVGVEIGVFRGENALSLLRTLKLKKLYLVDPYEKYDLYKETTNELVISARKEAYWRLRRFLAEGRVEFIHEFSIPAAKHVPVLLDFAYVDGNHAYEFVIEDLRTYWEKLKPSGLLLGDDFHLKGVARAVLEFEREIGVQAEVVEGEYWFVKPLADSRTHAEESR